MPEPFVKRKKRPSSTLRENPAMTLETVGVVRGGSQPRRTVVTLGGPFPHGRARSWECPLTCEKRRSTRLVSEQSERHNSQLRLPASGSLSIALTRLLQDSLQSTNFCTLQSGGYYTRMWRRSRDAQARVTPQVGEDAKGHTCCGCWWRCPRSQFGRGQKPTLL